MKTWIVITAALVLLSTAQATVWYVHPDSSLNSIQTGLNSCSTGDTVLVGPGTYTENIVWPNIQGIDLVSAYGPDSAIIDGDSAGSVISIIAYADTTTVIRGFTIQHGFANDGGGINCHSEPTIRDNIITDNVAIQSGGGIRVDYAYTPVIINNTIRKNTVTNSTYWGGGIMIYGSVPFVSGNTITENRANWGAGLVCYACPAQTRIRDNVITNNTALYGGGGVYIAAATQCTLATNTITNNAAGSGAGIYIYQCTPSIQRNSISQNTAYQYGGGVYCYSASPNIRGNQISNNNGNVGGGGIGCYNSSPIIDSCRVLNNNLFGIYCFNGSNPVINYNQIAGNAVYGVVNYTNNVTVNAEYNWWGDSTGPYHPDSNPGGLGDTVSDYVDFIPWLYWAEIKDRPIVNPIVKQFSIGPTIFRGPLVLPVGKTCRVFDIMGRVVEPAKMKAGIYFIQIDGEMAGKVIKVK